MTTRRIWDQKNLDGRNKEHFEIAKSFKEEFTRSQFIDHYKTEFSDRKLSSILPADYCYNNKQKAKAEFPLFLEWLGYGYYRFIGLETEGGWQELQNPLWTREELILVIEFYKIYAPNLPEETEQKLLNLSKEVLSLAHTLALHEHGTSRSPNSVHLKLMELRKRDLKDNGKDLGRKLPKVEQEIWDMPLGELETKAGFIRAIMIAIKDGVLPKTKFLTGVEPETESAKEGKWITKLHQFRERNEGIVKEKKKRALKDGKLTCEACQFDFSQKYGERGESFIECHHKVPVSEMKPGGKTNLEDLALLCANCHRMIHTKKPWLTVQNLTNLITDQKNTA